MIIINADDFGISSEVNHAIVECFKKNLISSTTIMMNMPFAHEAIQLAFKHGFTDSVGLHFNMVEGKPMTKNILACSRICSKGMFSYKRNSVFFWSSFEKKAIIEEFEAQLYSLIDAGIQPSHIDSHMHTHTELPIFNIIKDSIKSANIYRMRATRNVGLSPLRKVLKNLINLYFRHNGFRLTNCFSDITLMDLNCKLDSVEIMCHPNLRGNDIVDCCRNIKLFKQFENLNKYTDL